MYRKNIDKNEGYAPDKIITLQIQIHNEKIKSYSCTRNQLKTFKLNKLRDKLKQKFNFPEFFNSMLYFKRASNNQEVLFEKESQFVASDVVTKERSVSSFSEPQDIQEEVKDTDYLGNDENVIIKIHIRQHKLNPGYSDKNEYCKDLLRMVEIEQFIEGLKELQYFPARFTFDQNEQHQITKRIIINFNDQKNMNDQTILALRIPYKREGLNQINLQTLVYEKEPLIQSMETTNNLEEEKKDSKQLLTQTFNPNQPNPNIFEVFGKVHKVRFMKNRRLEVDVDINRRSPLEFEQIQILPDSNPNLYENILYYAIRDDTLNKNRARMLIEEFKMPQMLPSIEFLRQAIHSGQESRKANFYIPPEIQVDGLPKTFSPSQREAVIMAMKERLSIIQGPPGTGKTLVVAAVAANWMKNPGDRPKVLICAPSNTAADFIAERLVRIPLLQDKVIRFYSQKREDLFNLKMEDVKAYQLISKFLYMDIATQLQLAQEISLVDKRQQNILMYLNHYFSDSNMMTDYHLNDVITQTNFHGYIPLTEIIGEYLGNGQYAKRPWGMMYQNSASEKDVELLAQFAENWELNETKLMIRKKTKILQQSIQVLGFGQDGIRKMSPEKFERFMQIKAEQEDIILSKIPIIVTTCKAVSSSKLSKMRFLKVVIDEATQASELEALMTMTEAEQVVLIGDQKQLGPIYKGEAPECDSMFTRLVTAKYSHFKMLKEQYRMHDYLLNVPNTLFYGKEIVTGYRSVDHSNIFLCKDKPLLFINHNSEEQRFGSSYVNQHESQMIVTMIQELAKNYPPSKFGFVSPYQGQIQRLKQDLREIDGVSDNIRTIDSWQGREKEFMVFSPVRCNKKGKIGFLDNYRRINVALTRAQHGLLIFGNANTLSSDPQWQTLISFFRATGTYVDSIENAIQKVRILLQPQQLDPQNNDPEDFW